MTITPINGALGINLPATPVNKDSKTEKPAIDPVNKDVFVSNKDTGKKDDYKKDPYSDDYKENPYKDKKPGEEPQEPRKKPIAKKDPYKK